MIGKRISNILTKSNIPLKQRYKIVGDIIKKEKKWIKSKNFIVSETYSNLKVPLKVKCRKCGKIYNANQKKRIINH